MVAVTLPLAGVRGGLRRTSTPASAPGCNGPEYRQFDMFAGDWDGYDVSAPEKLVARIHVTPMAGGCALREVYEQNDGLLAESFSMYDAGRGVWHQSWVTNYGQLMLMEGHLEGDTMVLTATDKRPGKDATLLKSTWHKAG